VELRLEITQRLVMECDCCEGSLDNHRPNCPREQLRNLQREGPRCPVCYKGEIVPNIDDYLECDNKACRSVFSRSEVCAGEDPDKLENLTVLDFSTNEHYPVLKMARKGHGKLRWKRIQKNLMLSVREAKKRMRELRKTKKMAARTRT
jgi:hypothetical protein